MSEYIGVNNVKEASFSGIVIRCGCTEEQKCTDSWHGYKQEPCPNPKKTEDLGVMSFYSSNPLKMWAWKIKQIFKR